MSDLRDRIQALSPEKRLLLEQHLIATANDAPRDDGAILRSESTDPAPLSFPQQRLWFFEQLAPGEPTYNAILAMRAQGPLDIERLRTALRTVTERHEPLRTVFPVVDRTPMQDVLADWPVDLEVTDLSHRPPHDRETLMTALVRDEARRPFDLTSDLTLRVRVIRLAEQEHVIAFIEHHIAFDGWSDEQLFDELEEVYASLAEARNPVLPDLPVRYRDFAIWQRNRLEDGSMDDHIEYWRNRLTGAPPVLELPVDHERPAIQRFAGRHRHFEFPAEVADGVATLSRHEGVTPFATLLAGFTALLARWSGRHDILLGSPVANRARVELEHLIGFFSNTVVLRTDAGGDPSFRALVRRSWETAVGAFEHQEVPFEKVVEAVKPVRDPSHNPLFQVNFRGQSTPPPQMRLPDVAVEPFDVDLGFSRFDLALELQLHPDAVRGYFEYNLALFAEGTIDRLLADLGALLADAVAYPDKRLSDLAFPSQGTRAGVAEAPASIRGARSRR